MKKLFFLLIVFCFFQMTTFSQNERGEGDIFVQSTEYKQANVVGEQRYVVEDLFTRLSLDQVKAKAKAEGKPYYIDFSASWCQPCKLMDQTTFRDYEVVKFTKENFYAVQLDMSDFDAIEMQAMYNITSLPTILFFDKNDQLIGRSTGLQTGTLFLKKLKSIKAL